MYDIEVPHSSWSSTHRELKNGDLVPNRGERKVLVTMGTYVIDHIPTGKYIVGTSRTVSAEVDRQIEQLKRGVHPVVKLQQQYSGQNKDIRLIEIPAKNMAQAKQIEARIRVGKPEKICLLN